LRRAEPAWWRSVLVRMLGRCADVEPSVRRSIGRRSLGSGSLWVPIMSSTLCDLRIRVLVEQPAEPATADDEVVGGRGDGPRDRWGLSKRPLGPVGVVVVEVDGEDSSRWRRLTISVRSSSSRRRVLIHRSAIAFAFGDRTGVRTIRIASAVKTASNAAVTLVSRSRIRCSSTVSTWAKSQARMPSAWAARNSRQLCLVRLGAGSTPARRRISQAVDGAIRWPSPTNSPWILR
jgi:hypothetical protein